MSLPRASLAALLLLAASTLEAQTTAFRSIGIAGPLYSTGTATVALGGTTVNFGGGACLPSNVGQGDELIINGETFHILSRNTSSQVTVQTPAVAAHTAMPFTITRAYTSLQAWETARQGDLVALNRVEVGVAYNDGLFLTGVSINGSITDATRFMRLTVAPFHRHTGVAGTGVILDGQNAGTSGITVEDDFAVVEWFELIRHRGANGNASASALNATGVLFQHLLIHDFDDLTNAVVGIKGSNNSAFTVRNTIIYDGGGAGGAAGIRGTTGPTTVTVQNTTILGIAGRGVFEDNGNFTVTNTIAMNNTVADFDVVAGVQSFNLSSDATAAGAGSLTNRLAANQFARITAGSEDLHLRPGADALNSGTTLGGFNVDVDGDGRPGTTVVWDIGADEKGRIHYYSIGTAAGTLYGTGTASAAIGTTTVTFAGGANLPANVGTGDILTFTAVPFEAANILSRDSATQMTLQGNLTSTHTNSTYTIVRGFNTLQAWENARQGDQVTQNEVEVGVVYNDGPFVYNSGGPASGTPALRISGSTTSPKCYMKLTVAPNQRHNGTAGTGAVLDGSNFTQFGVRVDDDYTIVEWLEMKNFQAPGLSGAVSALASGRNVVFQGMLIHDFFSPTGDATTGIRVFIGASTGQSFTARNCVLYNGDRSAIVNDNCDSHVVVENVTVYNMHGTVTRAIYVGPNGGSMSVTNSISMGNTGPDFITNGGPMTQSNNLSSDATAAGPGSLINKLAANQFVNLTAGFEDFHLKAGADALDAGTDLSARFWEDIDRQSRLTLTWDIGADESGAPTAVKLSSFEAKGYDGKVVLEWKTASELRNLGFHLYRAAEGAGPYQRITAQPIPGLGSSPSGAEYRHVDSGLENGLKYFYQLEDIDSRGASTRHGPRAATPRSGAALPPTDGDSRSVITFGNPAANRFELRQWSRSGVTVEVTTEGFYARSNEDGTVDVEIPGFDVSGKEGSPAIPLLRPWIDSVAGRSVRLVSVEEAPPARFESLSPSGAARPGIEASHSGVVRAKRRSARRSHQRGLFPEEAARILGKGYQGNAEKVQLELSPLRWDDESGELLLSRRLVVRLSFERGRDETSDGSKSRRAARQGRRSLLARLATIAPGLYAVRYDEVFGRGARVFSAESLRLSRLGEAVAFHLEPDGARWGPGSRLYFVSPGGSANPYGHEAMFELELSKGTLMEVRPAASTRETVSFALARVERETNRFYQAGLVDAPDIWLWDMLLSPATKSFPFEVDALADGPVHVEVRLQGASDFDDVSDHHLAVYVNETWIGETTWDGKTYRAFEAEVASGVLKEGANALELRNLGDAGAPHSMVFLDRFTVQYPQKLDSRRSGPFEGEFSETGAAVIAGVGTNARVVDVTVENRPIWLSGASSLPRGSISFMVEQGRRYLAASEEELHRPRVERPSSSRLRGGAGSDYLVIAPRRYFATLEPLLELRRGQGLKVRVAPLEAIFDEFGFGERRPEAIRDFLRYAYHEKSPARLRYVLLVGDATYDFKDYLETGVSNQLPPLIVRTSYLWTASDPSLAMVNGDDLLPDVALGRLPAADDGELRLMIDKILAFESGTASVYSSPMVLVADNPDAAGDFIADADEIAAGVLAGRNVRKIYLSSLGTQGTREGVLRAFDDGSSLVSYMGHGGISLWADENVLSTEDVSRLRSQAQQPLLLTMNCLNGYYHFPYFDSLGEALLKAGGRGAVAAFSPSGLSLNEPAHRYHQALLEALFRKNHRRLGDAVLDAQEVYAASGAFPELLVIYHLLGDPALVLR